MDEYLPRNLELTREENSKLDEYHDELERVAHLERPSIQ